MILVGSSPLAVVFNGATSSAPARTNASNVTTTVIMWGLTAND